MIRSHCMCWCRPTSFCTRGACGPAVGVQGLQDVRRAVRVLVGEAQVVVGAQVQAPLRLACQRQSPAQDSRV